MLTKLEGVNELLAAIGERPVSSLTSGLEDAENAERVLILMSKTVQEKGWHNNTDYKITMQHDINGNIWVPANVLRIDTAGVDRYQKDVTIRRNGTAKALWNKSDSSFVFTSSITADLIWYFEFDDLPFALQAYIVAKAAKKFQTSELGSVSLDAFTVRDETEAWAALQDAEEEAADANALKDNFHSHYITYRNAPTSIR